MQRVSPLMDCTNAMYQAANRLPVVNTPKAGTRRHNPYECCLLAPEDYMDNSGSDVFGSPLTPNGYSSLHTDDTATTSASRRGLSVYSTPFVSNAGGRTDSHAGTVSRSLFNAGARNAEGSEPRSAEPTPMKHSPTKSRGAWTTVPYGKDCHYAEVKVLLRSGAADFIVADIPTVFGSSQAVTDDMLGQYVLVEGDRGEDLGCVQSVTKTELLPASRSGELFKKIQSKAALPCVLRVATPEEKQAFDELDQAEAEALECSRASLAMIKLDVPITIERAIFQFDRNKLTLQYTSRSYVDFNALTRHLHGVYKCRIWMDQLNREVCANTSGRKKNSNASRSQRGSKSSEV